MTNLPILFCELAGNLHCNSASKDSAPTYIQRASVSTDGSLVQYGELQSKRLKRTFDVQEACEEFLEGLERSQTMKESQIGAVASSNATSYVTAPSEQHWTEVRSTEFLDSSPYRKPTARYHESDLKIMEQIGEGGQGQIYNVIRNETSRGVLKVFKSALGTSPQGQWPDEILQIENYYLCNLIAYVDRSDGSIGLLMDKYDSDLRSLIDRRLKSRPGRKAPFSDYQSMQIIACIALGIKALHDHGVTHRDLKASNILLNIEDDSKELYKNIVLTDFEDSSEVVGTLFWRAPEVLRALKNNERAKMSAIYTSKADIYSFGMTCYEILTGEIPLNDYPKSNYDVVLVERKRPLLPSHVHPKLADLIRRCWHHDADTRPTASEIVLEIKRMVQEDESLSHILIHLVYDDVLEGPTSFSSPLPFMDELQEHLSSQRKFLSSEGFVAGRNYVSDVSKFVHQFGSDVNEQNSKEALAMGLTIGKYSSKVQVEIMAPLWWNNVSRPVTEQVLKLFFKSGAWIAYVLRLYNKRSIVAE